LTDHVLKPETAHFNLSSYGWAKFCQHAHAMAAGYPDGDATRGPKLYFYSLAIELGLKAAIFAKSPLPATKSELRDLGHNLIALLDRFEQDWSIAALGTEERAHVNRVNDYFRRKGLEYFTGEMLMAIMNGWRDLPDPQALEGVAASINAFLASHNYFIDV
jgi:hypothetical protein